MTSPATPTRPPRNDAAGVDVRPLLPTAKMKPAERRSVRSIAGGVALILLASLLGWFAFTQTQTQNRVLQVRADLARGETIEATDLQIVTVGAIPGISTVGADQAPALVGQKALIDLKAGSLLPSGAVGAATLPAAGFSLVGISPAGVAPTDIRPGSTLRLVITAPQSGAQAEDPSTGATFEATMVTVTTASQIDGGGAAYTVQVAAKEAPLVAQMAAEGRVAVVKDADR